MITSQRHAGVHKNMFMRIYSELEERGLPLAFHAGPDLGRHDDVHDESFSSVHSMSFVTCNMMHMTNWIVNGLPERFPKLKVIWIESGLAWVPFMMQRLDHEYLMRQSDAPLLKRLPSEYMPEMFFTSQPLEVTMPHMLEATFKAVHADTQLMYSSDWPHWDFDVPARIAGLPFLDEQAKRNILGENARKAVSSVGQANRITERTNDCHAQSSRAIPCTERSRSFQEILRGDASSSGAADAGTDFEPAQLHDRGRGRSVALFLHMGRRVCRCSGDGRGDGVADRPKGAADVPNYATGGVTHRALRRADDSAKHESARQADGRFNAGMQIRRDMFGPAKSDKVMESATDFNRTLQELVTSYCFGEVWARPQLDRRTRSMLTMALLVALNRPNQLKGHVRGAVKNGVTKDEIREVLLHAMIYAGVPAGVDSFNHATDVLKEMGLE